ncbi:MAG: methyltransferase domain-containing protein [Burkholderiales bacterium]
MLDRIAVRRRFARAAPRYAEASRLEAEVGARMLERLDYVKVAPRRVLDAGCGPAREADALGERYPDADLLLLDVALPMLRLAKPAGFLSRLLARRAKHAVCGELERLPVASWCVGLAWSNMALHWVADPLAAIRELHRVLMPEGLLMFSTLGPDSLKELRAAAGPSRVHAFTDMHDFGDMLVAAGFAAPVMDAERVTLTYSSAAGLLADLRTSGQTCALAARRRGLAGRGFLSALTRALDGQRRADRLEATFEVVYGHAWKGASARAADGSAIMRFERAPARRIP